METNINGIFLATYKYSSFLLLSLPSPQPFPYHLHHKHPFQVAIIALQVFSISVGCCFVASANKKIQSKENMVMHKQDIVTILGSESNRNGSQNSQSKVTSELDVWSSILNQKNKDEASQSKPPPYIHPLVKNSKNYLSEKSLEICTESLGSETGSDGFSSYTISTEDNNSNDDENLKEKVDMAGMKIRCFPPPLPSLFSQSQPLQMTPQRDNGRLFLFLQVVSVHSHNNFFAKRQNGRLILTFATNDEEEIDEDFEEDKSVIEKTQTMSSEITSIPNLELAVNKTIWLVNKRPKCSKFNQVFNFEDVKVVQHGSLPMINGYEYYWRNKATRNVAPSDQQSISNKVVNVVCGNMNINQASNEASQDSQQLFVLRGVNNDYLVHSLKFCKDSRTIRSFMLWDPCCIAT